MRIIFGLFVLVGMLMLVSFSIDAMRSQVARTKPHKDIILMTDGDITARRAVQRAALLCHMPDHTSASIDFGTSRIPV